MNTVMAKRLLNLTKDCRDSMHEPDEQGFKRVRLIGDHLDNAMGDHINPDAIVGNWQEYVLIICKDEKEGCCGTNEPFNLASLIALARYGATTLLEETASPEKVDYPTRIREAVEVLRKARNNMGRAAYWGALSEVCEEPNLRLPLLDAGDAASTAHKEARSQGKENTDG